MKKLSILFFFLFSIGATDLQAQLLTDELVVKYTAKVVGPNDKRVVEFPLHPLSFLVEGSDLPANFSLVDVEIAPGAPGAPPHVHKNEDEVYYILEGEMTFMLGDKIETAKAGSAVILPRGIMHATWNEGDKPAKALTIISQHSRFEFFFDHIVEEVRKRELNNPMEIGGLVAELGAQYDVKVDMTKMPKRAMKYFGM